MKNAIFLTLLLFTCLQVNSQDYLLIANDCFEKGDYECAKKNYILHQTWDGKNMSKRIKRAEDCFRNTIAADEYFKDQEFRKARDRYKIVLEKNPKDQKAKRRYELCVEQLDPLASNKSTSSNSVSKGSSANRLFANFTETSNNLNIEMIAMQGGTFTMGCTSEQGNDCFDDEKPGHQVTVSDFYIGKYTITQAQWKAVMDNNPSQVQGDDLPVEQVSWTDVQEFIRKLNAQTGKQYRLPTEAEWEFAARGGTNSRGYKYSGSNTLSNVAWYADNSAGAVHAVGTKSPNESGIHDMSGNIWEWCNDWYSSYSSNAQTDPQGASSGSARVRRGGSWSSFTKNTRVSNRSSSAPDHPYYYYYRIGFRLACSLKSD